MNPEEINLSTTLQNKDENEVIRQHLDAQKTGLHFLPQKIRFASQNPDERIFLYVRRHWSENISWIVNNFIYCLIPPFIIYIFNLINFEIDFLVPNIDFIILAIFYSVILTNVIRDYIDWYFDIHIVTNQRIVKYTFKPFIKYDVKEALLESVQKVKEEAGGVLSNIWGYGKLRITIEGPQEEFLFENISNPTKVRDIISDLVQVAKKYSGNYK